MTGEERYSWIENDGREVMSSKCNYIMTGNWIFTRHGDDVLQNISLKYKCNQGWVNGRPIC